MTIPQTLREDEGVQQFAVNVSVFPVMQERGFSQVHVTVFLSSLFMFMSVYAGFLVENR